MKRIYFVRHGETDSNEKKISQTFDTPLSKKGINQAIKLAKRFKKTGLKIDALVSSDMPRAVKTAEILAENFNVDILFSSHFQEVLKPSVVRGKPQSNPESLKIMKKIRSNWGKDWKHSDEENFFDVKKRAIKGIKYLMSLDKENMLVVTHGKFLRMIFGYLVNGKDISPKEGLILDKILKTANTGISIFEFDEEKGWRVVTWNDHSHLLGPAQVFP